MATPVPKYPKIPRKIWWLLRDRFKKSVPSAVSPTYVHSLSPMVDASAKSNVIAPLRVLGLIDENGKPTPLAERWRHDDEYANVCREIRASVYPAELVEAYPEPGSDRGAIKSWFMKVGQVGDSAARAYTDTYLLLTEADPSKSEATTPPSAKSRGGSKSSSKPKVRAPAMHVAPPASELTPQASPVPTEPALVPEKRLPAIHIDVQVHISPDTSAEQIDRIFESMARHLGGFVK